MVTRPEAGRIERYYSQSLRAQLCLNRNGNALILWSAFCIVLISKQGKPTPCVAMGGSQSQSWVAAHCSATHVDSLTQPA